MTSGAEAWWFGIAVRLRSDPGKAVVEAARRRIAIGPSMVIEIRVRSLENAGLVSEREVSYELD